MAVADRKTAKTDSYHDGYLAQRLEDPEFRREFERASAETEAIDAIVNELDQLRA